MISPPPPQTQTLLEATFLRLITCRGLLTHLRRQLR